jgi:hypothetical protein
MGAPGRKTGRVDYFILGVDRELVDSVIAAMKADDIKDWAMDLVPLAVARLLPRGKLLSPVSMTNI